MSGTKEIKRRITSIKSTKKITKAMELVSASKMRKMVSRTLVSRPYASLAHDILHALNDARLEQPVSLMDAREVKRTLVVLISSNRGLCGVYNAQIAKKTFEYIRNVAKVTPDVQLDFLTIGKKAGLAAKRMGNVVASFDELPDDLQYHDTLPISKMILDEYSNGKYDSIIVAYTDFKSVLTQIPRTRQLLPLTTSDLENELDEDHVQKKNETEYIFEPTSVALIEDMLKKLIRYQILQMILESRASEESSRMLAMKNANEAAGEMIDDLTLVFNKARQAGITQEISEISGGMSAME